MAPLEALIIIIFLLAFFNTFLSIISLVLLFKLKDRQTKSHFLNISFKEYFFTLRIFFFSNMKILQLNNLRYLFNFFPILPYPIIPIFLLLRLFPMIGFQKPFFSNSLFCEIFLNEFRIKVKNNSATLLDNSFVSLIILTFLYLNIFDLGYQSYTYSRNCF